MKSLHKTLNILDELGARGSCGIRELAARLEMPPATVHRIVATLTGRGYLKQDPVTKKVDLSERFLELGARVRERLDLPSVARPHMDWLMRETRESVNLAVQDGDQAVYLEQAQATHGMLRLFTRPGARVPLYCTGVGKMFLSRCSSAELEAYLSRTELTSFTTRTIVGAGRLRREMERIHKQGFALDDEEMEEGVRCVAALVCDQSGRPAGAVSISGAAARIGAERIARLGASVRECAAAISRELGFNDR